MEHSVHPPNRVPTAPAGLAVEASITLLGALFAFLALDDIATDNATTGFLPEFSLLGCVGTWLLFLVFQLWRKRRRVLAGISALLLSAGAWVASDGIGHTNAGGWSVFWPEYSLIVMVWLWFAAIAVVLLAQAFRHAGDAAVIRAPNRE